MWDDGWARARGTSIDLRLTVFDLGAGVSLAAGDFGLHIEHRKSSIVNLLSSKLDMISKFSMHNSKQINDLRYLHPLARSLPFFSLRTTHPEGVTP